MIRFKFLCVLCCVLISPVVCAANVILKTSTTPPIRKVDNGNPQNERQMSFEAPKGGHVVRDGDTLFGIARMYGTSYQKVMEANGMQEGDVIKIGQRLNVPQSSVQTLEKPKAPVMQQREVVVSDDKSSPAQKQVAMNNESGVHIVRDGDTLFGIARMYAISPIDLAAENGFDLTYMVRIGQKVKIPTGRPIVVAENNVPPKQTVVTEERGARNVRDKLDSRKINCELAFGWPVYSTEILNGYGETLRNGTKLDGVVIASEINKNVIASQSGEVAYIGSDIPEYGKLMIIKHKNNWMTIYGYLNTYNKKVGDQVSKGDLIATVGQTGNANGPSLYFSIRKIKAPYNPELCI